MIDPKFLRVASLVAPAVLALGLIVDAVVQRNRFVRDSDRRQQVEAQISALLKSLEAQAQQPMGRRAAVPDLPTEESTYLTFLRSAAQETGIKIVRWSANPRQAKTTPPPGNTPPSPALADVTPISGALEVAGSYRGVLAFARRMESNERLLNLSNVSWNRSEVGFDVHLTATITRYVIPATPVAATPPPNSPATAPSTS